MEESDPVWIYAGGSKFRILAVFSNFEQPSIERR
jgi:hypothetical protein